MATIKFVMWTSYETLVLSNRRDGWSHNLLFLESGFSDKNNSVFEGFDCIGAYEELCHLGCNDM
jgi:hypothetical protein